MIMHISKFKYYSWVFICLTIVTCRHNTHSHCPHRIGKAQTQISHPLTPSSAAKKYIQPYLHKVFAWTKQNNLLLNPDKITCTLFTSDPAEYTSNLDLTINNKSLPMATHPKVLGLTLDPKLTYSTHIHTISVQAHQPLQIIKALTATGWDKQMETLMAPYKAAMRPALEYTSSVWSPIVSTTNINKLQVMQNAALRTATGCTQDINIHLHDETLTLPIHEHLQLHASQYKQKTQHPSQTLHKHTTYFNTLRLKKSIIFNNGPLHNKHSHRAPHSQYNRHKNKHAPYTYIYCL